MATRITESELLEELARFAAGDAPEDAKTKRELMAATRMSSQAVLNRLRVFQDQGRVKVYQVRRQKLDGHMGTVPAYTIMPAKKR